MDMCGCTDVQHMRQLFDTASDQLTCQEGRNVDRWMAMDGKQG